MEVVKESESKLANCEVYTLLKDIQEGKNGHSKPNRNQRNLSTVVYSAVRYLDKSAASEQKEEHLSSFLPKLEAFKLTKAEKLQLLNQRPETAVELLLMIEECEDRLNDSQIDELLAIIKSTLPSQPSTDNNWLLWMTL